MPSLILNAADIAKLLEESPEVKIALLKNATDQIAESLKRKAIHGGQSLTDQIVQGIITEVKTKLRGASTFPPEVNKAITAVAQSHLERMTRIDIDVIVKRALEESLTRAQANMQARADEVIRKSFADMVDAASRLRR